MQMSSSTMIWSLERGKLNLYNLSGKIFIFCLSRVEKEDPVFKGDEHSEVKEELSAEVPAVTVTPAVEEEKKPRKPSNLVTSWGPGVTKVMANSKSSKGSSASSKEQSGTC